MRNVWTILLLFGSIAWGQALPAAPTPKRASPATKHADDDDEDAKAKPASVSKVAPNAAVLTINGLCSKLATQPGVKPAATSAHAACQTAVSREQFEKLVIALMPEMSPQTKRQFANSYPRLLVMAHEAQTRGLDKGTRFEQILAFARLQILSQELVRDFKEEAAKVPENDIADYYRSNAAAFEQVTVERIFVPARKQMDASSEKLPGDTQAQQKAAADEMTKEAEALRVRAAAGEDFTRLQQEAYDAAGFKTSAAPSAAQKLRRTQLAASQVSVFDLKPGEVSPVFSDSTGNYIFKLVSKGQQPLTEVRAEIRSTLQTQRLHAMMDRVDHSFTTDVNQAYFENKKPKADEDDD